MGQRLGDHWPTALQERKPLDSVLLFQPKEATAQATARVNPNMTAFETLLCLLGF